LEFAEKTDKRTDVSCAPPNDAIPDDDDDGNDGADDNDNDDHEDMIGDFFTKPLQGSLFRKFRAIIMNLQE